MEGEGLENPVHGEGLEDSSDTEIERAIDVMGTGEDSNVHMGQSEATATSDGAQLTRRERRRLKARAHRKAKKADPVERKRLNAKAHLRYRRKQAEKSRVQPNLPAANVATSGEFECPLVKFIYRPRNGLQ